MRNSNDTPSDIVDTLAEERETVVFPHHLQDCNMKTLLTTLLILAPLVASAEDGKPRESSGSLEKGFVRIFDGKTLKGWEGNLKTFRVEDGAIVGGSKKSRIPNNEFLCTKKTFENFELRLKAKLVGEGKNAGIQFRSKRIPNHHEVIGFQADIGVMGKDHSIWGALYDESRRRKFLAEGPQDKLKKLVKQDDWNDITIRCQNDHIQITVNGVKTVDYVEKDKSIERSGIIGVQIHGGAPAEASYKDIRIKVLD
jgi:hypothetical protein